MFYIWDSTKNEFLHTSNIWMRQLKLRKGSCNCIVPFLTSNATSKILKYVKILLTHYPFVQNFKVATKLNSF